MDLDFLRALADTFIYLSVREFCKLTRPTRAPFATVLRRYYRLRLHRREYARSCNREAAS